MAANQILSLPAAATGLAPVSSATAWTFGTAVTASASLPAGINIIGLQFQVTNIPTVDTTQQILFDITVGGITKVQIPYTQRSDTAVGFYPSVPYSGGTVFLPEPYKVPGGSAVAVQVTDSLSSAITYNGVKILYQENTPPTVALDTPTDAATGVSTTPDLLFTGTDADADEIQYNVQVDTVNTFDSQVATPTLISSVVGSGAADVTTTGIDTTGANLLIIALACDDAYNTTPTDSKGNTWTQLTSYTQGNVRVRVWFSIPTSVGTSHTFSASGSIIGTIFAHAFSGVVQTSPNDQQNGANSFNTSLATGSITPVENGELLFTVYGINGVGVPISIDSSFTETHEVDFNSGVSYGGATAYLIQTTAAAINPTWTRTNSNGQAATIISFKRNKSPLLNKLSVTPDATFTDVTNGADTTPFASGDQIKYTVQAGDTLTASTTYYWRVRGLDPSGSNVYGEFGNTDSGLVFPATAVSDAAVGVNAWTTPTNVYADDAAFSFCATHSSTSTGNVDDIVRLVVGGIIVGTDLSNEQNFSSAGLKTFGGATSLWGLTPTVAEVNASDFGVVLSVRNTFGGALTPTQYLKVTNFGLSIPTGTRIVGIEVIYDVVTAATAQVRIDYVQIKIYFVRSFVTAGVGGGGSDEEYIIITS